MTKLNVGAGTLNNFLTKGAGDDSGDGGAVTSAEIGGASSVWVDGNKVLVYMFCVLYALVYYIPVSPIYMLFYILSPNI